jgi:hypothetical protein
MVELDRPLVSVTTSADGAFECTAPSEVDLAVAATKGSLASATALVADDQPVELILVDLVACDAVVLDELRQPIQGATLWVFRRGAYQPALSVSTTGPDGHAQLAAVPDGWVVVRASGFATVRADLPGPGQLLRIIMAEGQLVAGVVVTGEGTPLAGVCVGLRGYLVAAEQQTDAQGRFAFEGVDSNPECDAWLVARMNGWATTTVAVVPGQTDVRLVMRRPGSVHGIVVYEDGTPAVGASVWTSEYRADREGCFAIPSAQPGSWSLRAWGPWPIDRRVTLEGTASFDLGEGQSIAGVRLVIGLPPSDSLVLTRVVDETGMPVAGATVVIFSERRPIARGTSDDVGTALVQTHSPPGTRVVVAAAKREGAVWMSGVAGELSTLPLTPPLPTVPIHLASHSSVRVRVLDPAGQDVERSADYVLASSRLRVDGAYDLPATETFSAVVSVPGCAKRTVVLEPPHDQPREVVLRLVPGVRLIGRLMEANGAPTRCAIVIEARQRTEGQDESQRAVCGPDGRFELVGLGVGPTSMRVFLLGTGDAGGDALIMLRRFMIDGPPTADIGDLVVPQLITFQGTVEDGRGVALAATEVRFLDPDGQRIRRPTTTLEDGLFRAVLPRALPITLSVGRHGYGTRFIGVDEVSPEPKAIVLSPEGRVRVVPPEAVRAGRWRVRARLPGTQWTWEPPEVEDAEVDMIAGARTYGGLPTGRLEIILDCAMPQRVRTVDVTAGETVACVFEE